MENYARSRGAKWLKEHAGGADWWLWPVLTKHNPNENPGIEDVLACRIFEDLERQHLLEVNLGPSGNGPPGTYRLNLSEQNKWDAVIKTPGRGRLFMAWIWARLNDPFSVAIVTSVLAFIGALLGAIIGAVATIYAAKLTGK